MNLNDYERRKELGFIKMLKNGNSSILESKNFDPQTGEEKDKDVQLITREQLVQSKSDYETRLHEMDAEVSRARGEFEAAKERAQKERRNIEKQIPSIDAAIADYDAQHAALASSAKPKAK